MSNTAITIRLNTTENSNLVAFASADILDTYLINGIKIWDNGEKGFNVEMPNKPKKAKDGKTYKNAFFSLKKTAHQTRFESLILAAYRDIITPKVAEAPSIDADYQIEA